MVFSVSRPPPGVMRRAFREAAHQHDSSAPTSALRRDSDGRRRRYCAPSARRNYAAESQISLQRHDGGMAMDNFRLVLPANASSVHHGWGGFVINNRRASLARPLRARREATQISIVGVALLAVRGPSRIPPVHHDARVRWPAQKRSAIIRASLNWNGGSRRDHGSVDGIATARLADCDSGSLNADAIRRRNRSPHQYFLGAFGGYVSATG